MEENNNDVLEIGADEGAAAAEPQAREIEKSLADREAELNAREMALTVRETLDKQGLPVELSKIITAKDEKDLQAKIELLKKYVKQPAKEEKPAKGFIMIGAPHGSDKKIDPIRKAMGLN